MTLIDCIETTAADAGVSAVGVCSPDPFAEVEVALRERIADGKSAGLRFTFGDPAVATDIRRTFPWAESLVVVARPYLPDAGDPGSAAPGTGRIARFATDDHYRDLRRGLGAIAEVLRAAGHRAEALTDDNRLVDRAAAVRAGIAWWGKSTMALAPATGPWTLLGTVVTDASLPETEPMRRDCGTCDACIPACPTGALDSLGVLDARKCLAAILQAPGVIPREFRGAVGDRVYGCDDCLEACPPGSRLLEQTTDRAGRVDLIELLGSDDRTLLERHVHFYVPRRQARFLRRNALVALGNTGGSLAVAVAAGFAGQPDPLLRAHATWALGALGGPTAVAALRTAGDRERDASVAEEIELALAATQSSDRC